MWIIENHQHLTYIVSKYLNLFQKIVADAALDAKVNAQLLNVLRQDEDHVIALPCPESFYLKGLEVAVN